MELCDLNPADYGLDLNNREIAALIWLGVLVAAVLLWKRGRSSAFGVAHAFFVWPLMRVFIAMTAYTVAMVALFAKLHLWEWTNLKTTLLWWVTVGFASIMDAQRLAEEPATFRKLLRDTVNITAAITFIAEFGSFPLIVELILPVPLTFIAMMLAVVPRQPGAAILIKPLNSLLLMAGLGFIAWSLLVIAKDPSKLLNWNQLREFGAPILLSVGFIPFLFGLSVVMTHEVIFTSLKIMWSRPELVAYAKWRALLAFGYDLNGMKRLARDLRMNDFEDRKSVDEAIAQIKRLKRREKDPPSTPADEGWSPHEAIRFLAHEGIVAGDWHPSFGEWRAERTVVNLTDGFMADNVSFYLSGSEFAATKIALTLNAENHNADANSDEHFFAMVLSLMERARTSGEAALITARLRGNASQVIKDSGWRFSMRRDNWGSAKHGGYSRRFELAHKAHVPTQFDEEFYEQSKPD